MTRQRWILGLVSVGVLSCLRAFDAPGPYQCNSDGTCPSGFTCDDGVCCNLGGAPACPTLPVNNTCFSGTLRRYFRDEDGDGFGASRPVDLCAQPRRGFVPDTGDAGRFAVDCDDTPERGAAINPLAPERCNGIDDNCDGRVDEGLLPRSTWFRDNDGDGFGAIDAGDELTACGQPPGYAPRGGDCDDRQADVFPLAPERCNNIDDNCNGQQDDPPFVDAESPGSMQVNCTVTDAGQCIFGGVQCLTDAVTQQASRVCVLRIAPKAELCNGVDDDCDGEVDNPPGCGGPPSLVSTPRVRTGAVRNVVIDAGPSASKLPQDSCMVPIANDAQSWFNPAWVGSAGISDGGHPIRHTWFAEAEGTSTWDLSQRTHLSVALDGLVELRFPGVPMFDTAWFPGPVVTLCGSRRHDFLRLSPVANQLTETGPWRGDVNLNGGNGWVREVGGNFSLSQVRRVELTVGPNPKPGGGANPFDVRTFVINVLPDAGFSK